MLKFWKITSLMASLIALASQQNYAFGRGTVGGGGGKGVVCRSPDLNIKSVEVLELWELRALRGGIVIAPGESLEVTVEAAIQNLSNSFPTNRREWSGSKLICSGQDCLLKNLSAGAQLFLTENKNVLRLKGARLFETDDAMELAEPAEPGCKIEQIVNYQPSGAPILVNQDLFEKMDHINQAALIVHEAYYQALRDFQNESDSLRVRRAVGYVFGGSNFNLIPVQASQPGEVVCESPNNYFVISKDFSQVRFGAVNGKIMIGQSIEANVESPNALKLITIGELDCNQYPRGISGTGWPSMGGPVEYDRSIKIMKSCEAGKKQISLWMRNPGENNFIQTPVSCKVKKIKQR